MAHLCELDNDNNVPSDTKRSLTSGKDFVLNKISYR